MPARYAKYGWRWQELNPDWSVNDWSEEAIRSEHWTNQAVIDHLYQRDDGRNSIELAAQVADVVGYEILWRYGGVYVNVDIEPVRSITDMEEMYGTEGKAWVAREDADFVVNAAMGAPASGHPFYRTVIDCLGPRYMARPHDEMNQTTGPRLLTGVYRSWTDHDASVVALPTVAFNPFHWSSIEQGGTAEGRELPEATIGVHHWGHRHDGRTNRIESGNRRASL